MLFSVIDPDWVASSTVSSAPNVKLAPVLPDVIGSTEISASLVAPPLVVEITGSVSRRKFMNLKAAIGRLALFPKCALMPL